MYSLAIAFLCVNGAHSGAWKSGLNLIPGDFAPGLFQTLPDFDDAVQALDSLHEGCLENLSDRLGRVASQHGVEDLLLGLKHKHFDMPEDTFLGETRADLNLSVMRPHSKSLLSFATPVSFSLDEGVWKPYEWALNNSQAQVSFKALQEKTDFLQNVTNILTSEGLHSIFGLHIKHRGHWEDAFGTMETPGDEDQELHIRPNIRHDVSTDAPPENPQTVPLPLPVPQPHQLGGGQSPLPEDNQMLPWPLQGPQPNQIGGGQSVGCASHSVKCQKHQQCNAHPNKKQLVSGYDGSSDPVPDDTRTVAWPLRVPQPNQLGNGQSVQCASHSVKCQKHQQCNAHPNKK